MSEVDPTVLKRIMPKFRDFLEKSEEAKNWVSERAAKDDFFKKNFTQENIEKIDEGVLRDLIHLLWSFNIWTNKDWLLAQMLSSGLQKIRDNFKNLLYSGKSLENRFDNMGDIKMMGAATTSEILAQHDALSYPIWNRRAKEGLIRLGISPSLLPKSSQISGSQYRDFCSLVQKVFATIRKNYPEITDLLKLDFLLYYVSTVYEDQPSELNEKFDHGALIDQILQLGDGLGFEVDKEFFVTQGCRIDALWRSRIANLGTVAYAFEVHKGGSRDSAILNLQRCRVDPSVQKVIIVSTEREIEYFKREISSLPEDFRNSIGYLEVKDLQKALEHQESIKNILASIGLLKSKVVSAT